MLTFPGFVMVKTRVYPLSHKTDANLWNLSPFTSTENQLWGQWCGTRWLAPTRSVTVTAAELSSTAVSLSPLCCFLSSAHSEGNPPQRWKHKRQCQWDSPTTPPSTTFNGLFHSALRHIISISTQAVWDIGCEKISQAQPQARVLSKRAGAGMKKMKKNQMND